MPIAWMRRWVPPPPGITPRLISGWPKVAVGEARMMSHMRASSQPPPSWVDGVNDLQGMHK